jgi:hypothetical protein
MSLRLRCAILFAALALTALAIPAAGTADSASEAQGSKKVPLVATPKGVGALRLGATVASLHRHHLIRRLRPGCELDPGQRIARLRPPLQGYAIFSHPSSRLSSLSISGGAETAKRIGIGSTPGEARAAYPRAAYQPPGSAEPFAEGFFWVNRIGHSKMTFVVDPESLAISAIAIPFPAFCE